MRAHRAITMCLAFLLVSSGLKRNHFRRFSGTHLGQGAPARQHSTSAPEQAQLVVAEFLPHATRLTQNKQLPSGAPNRRGNVETRRTRWLSRVNPMAGSWSLTAYPR